MSLVHLSLVGSQNIWCHTSQLNVIVHKYWISLITFLASEHSRIEHGNCAGNKEGSVFENLDSKGCTCKSTRTLNWISLGILGVVFGILFVYCSVSVLHLITSKKYRNQGSYKFSANFIRCKWTWKSRETRELLNTRRLPNYRIFAGKSIRALTNSVIWHSYMQ